MTYANVQYQNRGNDEGDVLNFFNDKLRNLIQRNSGDNTFSIVQENCHDKDEPVRLNTKTKIRMTHSAHTMSQIEKGFIEITLKLNLELDGPDHLYYDKAHRHLQYIFVGFKDAVEIISEAFFWVDGRLVDNYHQNEMVRESFAYNCIRGKDAKKANPHSHSLWEDVCMMSPNVCGCYIPLEKFFAAGKDDDLPRKVDNTVDDSDAPTLAAAQAKFVPNKKVDVEIKLCIPFTDQLVLQAWRLYPNRILGEMEEEIKFALNGLVWCQVHPKHVAEVKKFWTMNTKAVEYGTPDFLPITNHFVQINNPAIIVNEAKTCAAVDKEFGIPIDAKVANHTYFGISTMPGLARANITTQRTIMYTIAQATLKVNENSCEIRQCKTNCAGFGIKPDVIQALMETLNEPIIIPAQELTRHQFEGHPDHSGFKQSKTIPLRNATNITVMFPFHSEDCTVFQNIGYKNVKLIVNKKSYPETEWNNTWDGRFVQYQLMANELDGMIEPTQEFVESISRPLTLEYTTGEMQGSELLSALDPEEGKRIKTAPFDNTSFGINFQLERGNAGYVFDGIDTGSHTVTIEFRGESKNTGHDNEGDVLWHPDQIADLTYPRISEKSSPPPPELWVCSDTYWTWSVQDGVRYYQRGIPAGYE